MGLQKGQARFGSLAPHRLADKASDWRISSHFGPRELAGLRIRFPRGRGDWAADACEHSTSDGTEARRPMSGIGCSPRPEPVSGLHFVNTRSVSSDSRMLDVSLSSRLVPVLV